MNFKKFLLIPVLALFPAITACGNSCVSACEDANECAGATKVDCDEQCDKFETLAEDAGCSDQYDDFVSCVSDKDDQCKADDSCNDELTKLGTCAGPYCMKSEHAAQCAALGGSGDD